MRYTSDESRLSVTDGNNYYSARPHINQRNAENIAAITNTPQKNSTRIILDVISLAMLVTNVMRRLLSR